MPCSRATGAPGCRFKAATHTWRFGPKRSADQARGDTMTATRALHDLGQSLWIDNITRGMLRSGSLQQHIDELSVTGLTSNPTIFDHAIKNGSDYDAAITAK